MATAECQHRTVERTTGYDKKRNVCCPSGPDDQYQATRMVVPISLPTITTAREIAGALRQRVSHMRVASARVFVNKHLLAELAFRSLEQGTSGCKCYSMQCDDDDD
jgi:hypothetical protein